jgi:hypothetical protein
VGRFVQHVHGFTAAAPDVVTGFTVDYAAGFGNEDLAFLAVLPFIPAPAELARQAL